MISGENVSHYRVIELLGAGGMGEVYKAEDTRLKRLVALKFLPLALTADADAKQRLVHEAQAASALDHPNICTIYEIDETPDGRLFIAMAYYDGETLKQRIARASLSVQEASAIMVQVARGVAAAHDGGILHRDIKPANIALSGRGEAKLLDFGLARVPGQTVLTRTGTTVGTVAYMAPEQIAGQSADERCDVWSLGAVFYEMLAGRPAFTGEHDVAILRAITDRDPPPLRRIRRDIPAAVESIVGKALQKDPRARYGSAGEFLGDVERLLPATSAVSVARSADSGSSRRPSRLRLLMGAVSVLVIAVALVNWWLYRQAGARSTRKTLQDIAELVQKEEFTRAFMRLREVQASVSADPDYAKVRDSFLWPIPIRTDPPDAEVYAKPYADPGGSWQLIGRSPIETHGCFCYFRWRVTKAGFSPFEGALGASVEPFFSLAPEGSVPEGMIRVPKQGALENGVNVLGEFFIDRFEVTNREFKKFVDAGGYRNREYWKEPFVQKGRTLSFDEAMAEFKDATGRSGPSTWELGTYPEEKDAYPVSGVSWYEAAAYARFTGKMLPTVGHWQKAAELSSIYSEILELSNFGNKGPARVGEFKGIGPYGTYDMAGNVKEWCWNEVGDRRYILGGAWNEPSYQFRNTDARLPFDRSPSNGVRLMKPAAGMPVPDFSLRPIERQERNYDQEKPVGNDVFRAYLSLFSYDQTDLNASIESVDDNSSFWRVERLTFAAAYGSERVAAYLFLPKHTAPPYQTIVYYPHGAAVALRSFQQAEMSYLGFMVKAGRALLLPMYKGTYERKLPMFPGPNGQRDMHIQAMKDLKRSVDYLETRNDIDHERLAFFGVSYGAFLGSMALSVEPRFKAAVFWSGGFPLNAQLPDVDPLNYSPHVKTPVLMLNGRDDFNFPIEKSQVPLFRHLGSKDGDKRRVLYDGGHIFPFARMEKDTLDWLDKYLGAPR